MGIPLYSSGPISTISLVMGWIVYRLFIAALIMAVIYFALVAYGSVSEWIDYWAPVGGRICHDGRCGGR